MKFRQTRVCHNCRRHKLGCDGKRPTCSQCAHTGRQCEGYPGLLFVQSSLAPQNQNSPKNRQRPRGKLKREPPKAEPTAVPPTITVASSLSQPSGYIGTQPPWPAVYDQLFRLETSYQFYPLFRPLPDTLQDTISLVVRSYVPMTELPSGIRSIISQSTLICGAWVEVLPNLSQSGGGRLDECLECAIKSLALSIMANRTRKPLLTPLSKHYGKSLNLLRRALDLSDDSYQNEKIAAMMCLTLSEALFPVAPNSWFVHLRAISEVMRSSRPDVFRDGIPHKLFTGIRPLLILEAMVNRRDTFLGLDEWKTIPFQFHGPSSMQNLLSHAAIIPKILQKADFLNDESSESDVRHSIVELSEMVVHLETSAITFEIGPNAPAYWPVSTRYDEAKDNYCPLWFSDLSAANAFTHLWAFEIVCLSKMNDLFSAFSRFTERKDSCLSDDLLGDPNYRRRRCIDLSINICQSLQYMTKEDWMMYGPSCAAFPLRIACDVLEMDDDGREILSKLSKSVLNGIDYRLLPFLGTLVR